MSILWTTWQLIPAAPKQHRAQRYRSGGGTGTLLIMAYDQPARLPSTASFPHLQVEVWTKTRAWTYLNFLSLSLFDTEKMIESLIGVGRGHISHRVISLRSQCLFPSPRSSCQSKPITIVLTSELWGRASYWVEVPRFFWRQHAYKHWQDILLLRVSKSLQLNTRRLGRMCSH